MSLVDKSSLINQISPPIDSGFANLLIDEFISIEKRFIQRDWEPAELDGGQFCEILGRILYHQDSSNLNHSKSLDDCIRYIENDQVPHSMTPRHDALLLVRVMRTIYKFRSQRGAVHISPNYKPNHMDSKIIVEGVRWCMNEVLRIFGQGDKESIASTIRELLRFDIPCIGVYGDNIVVQRTDLSEEEEVLLILHYGGEEGFRREKILNSVMFSTQKLTNVIQRLVSTRLVVKPSGTYILTDLGNKYIREKLSEKLILQ